MKKLKIGCLGIIAILFIIYFIQEVIISGVIFLRLPIYGKIIDKETGKPITYALIRNSYNPPWNINGAETIISDKAGNYKLKLRIIFGGSFDIREGEFIKRDGQHLKVWFPGYKKYEIETIGKELISSKLDIYLKRPETAEEAASVFEDGGFPRPEDTKARIVFYKAMMKESLRIITTYPNTTYADKVFGNFYWDLKKELYKEIKMYYLNVPCENLLKRTKSCKEDKEEANKE